MDSQKPPRLLLCVTFAILFAFATSVFYYSKSELPPSITINTKNQPTIGYEKAKVHVVVFEEPKCSHCRDFNNNIFSKIKKEFIDTNKINYTIIPVSFMPGSMPAAIAALCVYHENPLYPNDPLFFKYFDYIYHNQPDEKIDWATPQALIRYAQATSPAIQLEALQSCIERETYRVQIEQNTDYGKQLMNGTIITPTVYVNGILVKELTMDEIRKLINEVLKNEGVH